jgi:oligoendopeptidase F
MNYKGYNIAIHEFGHTVEQTITLHNVDYYMLNGVPNTAFTEAIAFLFQKRDLKLLGMEQQSNQRQHLLALSNLWSSYEIMGVSLVDMNVWKWMYDHPNATPEELKNAVTRIAKEIWNKYYAEVFGVKDSPILAIYSHMISSPLYLSNYPLGHLIHFQIEQYVEDKDLAKEITRMLEQGKITPQQWMKGAVGNKVSNKPLLNAADEAVEAMN